MRKWVGELMILITPEKYYVKNIKGICGIKAIVLENGNHFITILNGRNPKTREEIYSVELKMFDLFPDREFSFSIYEIENPTGVDWILRTRQVLFQNKGNGNG